MSHPHESNPQNSGDNFTGPSIDMEALRPLSPEEWSNIELTIGKVQEFMADPASRRFATYQPDATDPNGDDENYRNHLLFEMSNRVLREDLPAVLEASEHAEETVISHVDAVGLRLTVEEGYTVTTPAVLRTAEFPTEHGTLHVEETEILANQGTQKMRIIAISISNT